MPRLTLVLTGFALVAAVAMSCGSSGDSGPYLFFGAPEGIVQYSLRDGGRRVIVAAPSTADSLRDPAVSDDGKHIVYSHAPPLSRLNGVPDAHSDLWMVNIDGSNPRMFAMHSRPSEVITSPTWLNDVQVLAVVRYLTNPGQPNRGARFTLVRIDVTTGARTNLVESVLTFGLSPDRTRIAYTAIESVEEQPLFARMLSGGPPTRLLDTRESGLDGFVNPIFSPDGETIYFGAHKETQVGAERGRSFLRVAFHTGPDSIWKVASAGGTPTLIADTELLEPSLAIATDGERLYGLSGDLYLFDLAPGSSEVIAQPNALSRISYVE